MAFNGVIQALIRGVLYLTIVLPLIAGAATNPSSAKWTDVAIAKAPQSVGASAEHGRSDETQSNKLEVSSLLALGGALVIVAILWKRLLARPGASPPQSRAYASRARRGGPG